MTTIRSKTLAALVVTISMLLAAPSGLAEPLAHVDGVAEVGTIDPWSSSGGESGGGGHDQSIAGESDRSTCIVPNPFGGDCIFTFDEHNEFEHADQAENAWYWYASENSTMSGYYVDVMGGVVFARASAGAIEEASGSGSQGNEHHYDRTLYDTNVGYSEENEDETNLAWDDAESSYGRVDRLLIEGGVNAPVGHAELLVDRQAHGESGDATHSEGAGSNESNFELFGLPITGSEDSQSHFLNDESRTFWNRTLAGGAIYLIDPRDGSHVDVLGIGLDRGDTSGSGSSEHASDSQEGTSVFGMTVFEHTESESGESQYAFFREWLHLSVDLVEGTVSGGVTYDHGEESSSGDESTSNQYDVFGIPAYGEAHETSDDAQSQWRDVAFELDAGQGAGVIHVDSWDDSSGSHGTYEDTYTILGIPGGLSGGSDSSFHSDGVGFGIDFGGGILWLGARYENSSSSQSSYDDIMLDHAPVLGVGSDQSDASRGIWVDAGSSLVPVGAGAHHENSSSSSGDHARLSGEEFFSLTQEDEHTEYGGNVALGDVFIFSLLYEDGHSDDAIHLAGIPFGVRDDYKRLNAGVGGDVVAPTGQHVFSYSFEHEETSDDYDLYADDSSVGGLQQNVTKDSLSVIVLDGAAGAHAEREFSNSQVFAGDDTEIAELGIQQLDAGVDHGGVAPAGVAPGGASVSVFLAYVEAADSIALIVGLATWCVDPGVPIPYDTLLGAMPSEVQPVAATGLAAAALLACFGAPVLVPLFAASPCIVIPLAAGTVFLTAGTVTSLLPAGSDIVTTAEGAFWETYGGSALSCVWLTIPDAARNPQPVIGALALATEASDTVLAQAWPVYDEMRVTAWGVIDMAFGLDQGAPMPAEIPAPPVEPPA